MFTSWGDAARETYLRLRATSIAAGNRNSIDGGVEMDGFSWPCTLRTDGKLCFPDVIAFKLEATGKRFLVACGRDSKGELCNELTLELGHPAPRSGFVEVSTHMEMCNGYYRKAGFPASSNPVFKFIGDGGGGVYNASNASNPVVVNCRLVHDRDKAIAAGLHTCEPAPAGLASPRHRCWDAYKQHIEVEYHIKSTSEFAFSSGRSPRDIRNTSTLHWEIVDVRRGSLESLPLKRVKGVLNRLRGFERPWDSEVRGTGKSGAKTTQDYVDAIVRAVGSLRGSFTLSTSQWSPRWYKGLDIDKYKPAVVVSSVEEKKYEIVFSVEVSGPEDRLRACGVPGRSATAALTKWGVVSYTSTEQDVWMITTKGGEDVAVIKEGGWWASKSDGRFLCAPTTATFTDDEDTLGAWWPSKFTGERGKDFLRRQPATRAAVWAVLLVAGRKQALPDLPVELWLIVLSFTRAHEIGPAPKIFQDTKTWGVAEGVYYPTGEALKFKKMETGHTLWFLPKASLPMALSVRDLRPVKPFMDDPRLRDQALMWQTLVTHRQAALKDPDDY